MFTGLVEGMGRIEALSPAGSLVRLTVSTPFSASELAPGESVAVEGVCLTAAALEPRGFSADVIAETLRVTTLGDLRAGDAVNLERALRASDRLGGHLVQGHVDGTARVLDRSEAGEDVRMRIELPPALRPYVARKGSIAVSGVSLTVSAVDPAWLEVALIPETLRRTTLGARRAGERVNLEVDLVARYLETLLGARPQRVAP
jgi:riboflavin synthase